MLNPSVVGLVSKRRQLGFPNENRHLTLTFVIRDTYPGTNVCRCHGGEIVEFDGIIGGMLANIHRGVLSRPLDFLEVSPSRPTPVSSSSSSQT